MLLLFRLLRRQRRLRSLWRAVVPPFFWPCDVAVAVAVAVDVAVVVVVVGVASFRLHKTRVALVM